MKIMLPVPAVAMFAGALVVEASPAAAIFGIHAHHARQHHAHHAHHGHRRQHRHHR